MMSLEPDDTDDRDEYQVALDVMVRWKDYGNYGSRRGAVAALQRTLTTSRVVSGISSSS